MGFLWKNVGLDSLIIQCYAPGHSRFNPIERSWSFLTQKIIGVTLPDDVDGKIPDVRDEKAWMTVLDNAVVLCARFWHKKYYAGFPISVETFLSDNPLVTPIKKTHKLLKDFSNASLKELKTNFDYIELKSIYTFFVKHSNRKAYQLEFLRCCDISCDHCSTLPYEENKFLELMNLFGGSCPTPEISTFYKDHYKTFMEMLQQYSVSIKEKVIHNPTSFGSCEHGCSYAFFSKADKARHMKLMKH